MAMDYARRSALAGKSLPALSYATLRGSVKRNDPDGISVAPYFPTLVGSILTLVLDSDPVGKTFSVTLPANATVQAVLALLNTVLSVAPAKGIAYEQDGVLYLQTLTRGSVGAVEVVGGDAAAILGFDLARGPLRSSGGDLPSAPEGHLGNPASAVFPLKGENLSTASFDRALGRLATNADVLYADHVRTAPRMTKLGTVSASSQTVLTPLSSLLTVPAGATATKLFTGYGLLGFSSPPEELVPFFVLVDTVTKRLAQSKVVAVVRGGVAGDPPYSNADDLSSTGNVLGQSFVRVGPLSIDNIFDGRFVYCAAGGLNVVKVGDVARLDGVNGVVSVVPWDNRGLRWVVEWVSASGNSVALRPMSASELALFSTTVTDNQPIVDLNSSLDVGQSYGTVTFFTGSYLEGLSIVVQPPLPPNASFELWAKVASSLRDEKGYENSLDSGPALRELLSGQDAASNVVLTRPTLANSAGMFTIGSFLAEWRGRVINVPGQVLDASDQGGRSVVGYWDPVDALVKLGKTGAFGVVPEGKLPLFFSEQSHAQPLVDITRLPTEQQRSATVGSKGQFSTIQQALQHIASFAVPDRFEIVVLENATAPDGGWLLPNSSVLMRGASPDLTLSHGATGPLFTVVATNAFTLEDFVVDLTKVIAAGVSNNITIRGLRSLDHTQRRSLDSLLENVDIGYDATGVDIGKVGAPTNVRGSATIKETLSVGGYLQALASATVLKLIGLVGAVQDVLVAPFNPHVGGDTTPILRVSNDKTGATSILDVTKDGITVNGVTTGSYVDSPGTDLSLGTSTALKVRIGKSGVGPIYTEVMSQLTVYGVLNVSQSIDTTTAINLLLGPVVATEVRTGSATIPTRIMGNGQVDGVLSVLGSLDVVGKITTGSATVPTDVNTTLTTKGYVDAGVFLGCGYYPVLPAGGSPTVDPLGKKGPLALSTATRQAAGMYLVTVPSVTANVVAFGTVSGGVTGGSSIDVSFYAANTLLVITWGTVGVDIPFSLVVFSL